MLESNRFTEENNGEVYLETRDGAAGQITKNLLTFRPEKQVNVVGTDLYNGVFDGTEQTDPVVSKGIVFVLVNFSRESLWTTFKQQDLIFSFNLNLFETMLCQERIYNFDCPLPI
ncbi:hypothetical protein Plhal703r1_c39g0136151 [Plasmopara halstedii]